jgi:hypothetical protein
MERQDVHRLIGKRWNFSDFRILEGDEAHSQINLLYFFSIHQTRINVH